MTTRFKAHVWMLSAAVIALSACAGDGKGPGSIGTKNDIVVRNHGLPQQPGTDVAAAPASPEIQTAEMLEANPAPAVDAGEPLSDPSIMVSDETQPLPDSSPAFETASEQMDASQAPVASTATTPTPTNDISTATTAPITDATQISSETPSPAMDATVQQPNIASTTNPVPPVSQDVAPPVEMAAAPMPIEQQAPAPMAAQPVMEPAVQPEVPVQAYQPQPQATAMAVPSSIYPASDYPAAAAAAVAPSASGSIQAPLNFYDPTIITAAQTALQTKVGYKGKNDGVISTEFLNSLSEYQVVNRLPQGGLNEPTLRSLGVIE